MTAIPVPRPNEKCPECPHRWGGHKFTAGNAHKGFKGETRQLDPAELEGIYWCPVDGCGCEGTWDVVGERTIQLHRIDTDEHGIWPNDE